MRLPWWPLAALLAACSKNSGTPASDAGTVVVDPIAHPCSVLRRSDVEPVLGTSDLQMDEQPGGAGDAVCGWSPPGRSGRVELRIHVPSRKADFSHLPIERKPIPCIGDAAYLEANTARGHVDVLKGDQTFYVQVQQGNLSGVNPTTTHTQATTLARTIASRM
jgi:hypothetical protein